MMDQEQALMRLKLKSVGKIEAAAALAAQQLYPSFGRGGGRLPNNSGPSFLLGSRERIDSILTDESACTAVKHHMANLKHGMLAVEDAVSLLWRTSAMLTTPVTPSTSHGTSPLLRTKKLSSLYPESALLLNSIMTKNNNQQQQHQNGTPRLSSNLQRTTSFAPSTIRPSEVTLDTDREHKRSLEISVPKKGDTTLLAPRPPRRRRKAAADYPGLTFPTKLYGMLRKAEADGFEDIISFLPHGKSFMIHQPGKFADEIMPKYFTTNRLASFQKQLNLYGFKKAKGGEDHGAMFHEFFQRDDQKLVAKINRRRQPVPCGDAFRTSSARDAECIAIAWRVFNSMHVPLSK